MTLGDVQRAALRSRVQRAREILTEDLREVLESVYGVHRDGRVEPPEALPRLADPRCRETRELLLLMLEPPGAQCTDHGYERRFDDQLRALAFTHLNRLVALKMLEHPSRKALKESVGKGKKSRGFVFWLADREDEQRICQEGRDDEVYERFLLDQCRTVHTEIGGLFDPEDLPSRLFPRPRALHEVLSEVNAEDLAAIWGDAETLGWVYQYYTPKELRDESREENKGAPVTSYEMAIRNQFYTPHWVVRFLADNTLGRLWAEMCPGTALRRQCELLCVPDDEVLPARPKKDPRDLRVLDPACGSGHFLLHCFDLLEGIYREAWDDPDLGPTLQHEFGDRAAFEAKIPKLIVEHNLFGVDIDPRAIQIAGLALLLKSKSRRADVTIERSGLVVARPLPTDALLAGFKERNQAAAGGVLGRLLDGLVGCMELADHAGPLLRLEVDVEKLVARERQSWIDRGQPRVQGLPFPGRPQEQRLDFSDVNDAKFWDGAEEELLALLRQYGRETEGARGAHKRLFARDGSEALRLVETLRQRYDVVLMNPPFGDVTAESKQFIDARYPSSRQNVAYCFVERGIELAAGGYVGTLSTDAGFFRRTAEDWRKNIILARSTLTSVAHLGGHVLDGATVRTAAYVVRADQQREDAAWYIRVHEQEGRERDLSVAAACIRRKTESSSLFRTPQSAFAKLPYAVFGYWCSPPIRNAFQEFPRLEGNAAIVRQGLATADDFRFLRLRWEVTPEAVGQGLKWVPFAKGGEFSPFHDDVHLVVNWGSDGRELDEFRGSVIRNPNCYFRPGLTYPPRTNKRFAPRLLPSGCAFGHKGCAILAADPAAQLPLSIAGLLNSRAASHLLSVGLGAAEAEGGAGANSYEVGLVQQLPVPVSALQDVALNQGSAAAAAVARKPDGRDETTASFILPFRLPTPTNLAAASADLHAEATADAATYRSALEQIEERVCHHYRFGPTERAEIAEEVGDVHALDVLSPASIKVSLARDLVSWAVGVAFGRFDVRLATGSRAIPPPSDPFAPVTARSPGMLHGGIIPEDYPIAVDADGILVDDEGHPDDVVHRVQQVLHVVFGDRAAAIESEVCAALDVPSLRAWFAKAGAKSFFAEHVKRYSKSNRKAPLYWLLQSRDRSYSVWLYALRVSRETIPLVLNERYLRGRIARTTQRIVEINPSAAEDAKLEKSKLKVLDEQRELLAELEDFKAKLEAVRDLRNERGETVGYDPDPDDGTILNLAPLRAVIPWPKAGELEDLWQGLARGDYDWSRLAGRLWPDRVRRQCLQDRSLAIAHGCEDLLPSPAPNPRRTKKPKKNKEHQRADDR